ncbi:MAG: toll/interleukin-1 receptor domain-containing protein [Hyphomicrobiales bacterium]|nr:toll/interleukin-1 receptor domain-containing protein [Hyphomicrobiales bacterium]
MAEIFISYSHKDEPDPNLHPGKEAWLTFIKSHLEPAVAHDQFEVWDDRRIYGGGNWRAEIEDALNRCAVCIFLVSRHSLSSRFILDVEIRQMLERRHAQGAHIFPIVITSCDIGAAEWLMNLNLRPRDGTALALYTESRRDKVMSDLAKEIREILQRPSQVSDCGASETTERRDDGSKGLRLWLDEIHAEYADERYASAYIHAPRQDARPGESLRIRLGASFGRAPTTGLPGLREVEVWVKLPAGLGADHMLGKGKPHNCESGVNIHFRGPSYKRPMWRLSAPSSDESLHDKNAATDDAPLFELPNAAPGERVTVRMVAFANRDFYCGDHEMPEVNCDPKTASAAKERIIGRLRLKMIGDPTEDGEIILCTTENEVEELAE